MFVAVLVRVVVFVLVAVVVAVFVGVVVFVLVAVVVAVFVGVVALVFVAVLVLVVVVAAFEGADAEGRDDEDGVRGAVSEDHVERRLLEVVAVDDHHVGFGDAARGVGRGAEAVDVGAGGDDGGDLGVVAPHAAGEVGEDAGGGDDLQALAAARRRDGGGFAVRRRDGGGGAPRRGGVAAVAVVAGARRGEGERARETESEREA